MIAALRLAAALSLLLPGIAVAQLPFPSPVAPVPRGLRDLDFGIVLPGISQYVDAADPGAAQWVFRGRPRSTVRMTFSALPGFLQSASDNLTVSFHSGSAAWNTVNDPAGARRFDPAVGATATIGRRSRRVFVWLGGMAVPTTSQASGDYSSTYTLDVTYVPP